MALYHTDDRLIWTPTTNNANQELGADLDGILPKITGKLGDVKSSETAEAFTHADSDNAWSSRTAAEKLDNPRNLSAIRLTDRVSDRGGTLKRDGAAHRSMTLDASRSSIVYSGMDNTVRPTCYTVTFFRRIA